jgi:4-hydroxy-3-methylbut-2-enyl diphosphate reductase
MKILRAVHLGMCFGVRDAIALAEQHSQQHPLTILGDLVHNETVLADLRARGIRIAREAGEVNTPHVMITAHGASQKAIAGARAHGLDVLEATCPLVLVAHRAITNLVKDGYYPVIIGQREHVEVRGLTGDLDESRRRPLSPLKKRCGWWNLSGGDIPIPNFGSWIRFVSPRNNGKPPPAIWPGAQTL